MLVFAFFVVLAPLLFRHMFSYFLVILGVFCGWGGASAAWGVPLGARSPSEMILGCFLEDFRLHLVTLEGYFGGHLGARVSKWSDYVDFFGVFSVPLKRSENATKSHQKRYLFGGGRHGSSVVNSSKKLVFRVFEQAPFFSHFWLHFGLHFGVILGANFATMLLFGRRGRQQGGQRGTFWALRFSIAFSMDFRCQGDLQEGCRRRGRRPLGGW